MSLHILLKDKITEEKLAHLPKGFEVIGDIAIINIPQTLEKEKYHIADALLSHRKDVRIVLRRLNKIRTWERIANFELLTGNRTVTVHHENGCIFQVDVTKTFFSGKLYYERNRVVQKVMDGENILVLFSGVGPFLIPIKKQKNVRITGLDYNRDACIFLRNNLELNDVEGNVIHADARYINNLFKTTFDRIVIPAPYGQDFFLDLVKFLLKPGGFVHFYTFKKDFEIPHFVKLLKNKGWHIEFYRHCGNVAPRVKRYVFDLKF